MTDPTDGLMVSALCSGGSSPGGAEIPEGAEDPVPIDSCFCGGISRIVRSRSHMPGPNYLLIAHEHVCLYAP